MAVPTPARHLATTVDTDARIVCVDLDGTLVAGDLLWEAFVDLVRQRPLRAAGALLQLARGRAAFKQDVARAVPLDAARLPYRTEVLDHLHDLRARGAVLVLATAADEVHAHAVAAHLGIFADVLASDGETNLSGRRKASALVARYGAGRFDYIGNSRSDVPVWRVSADATAVAATASVVRHVAARRSIDALGRNRRGTIASLIAMARPHQWVKNLLVFVPLLTSHTLFELDRLGAAILAWIAFSLCASGVYIVNDAFDIQADRAHPRKRSRPLAAGDVGVPLAVLAALLLTSLGLTTAAVAISWQLALVVVVYIAVSTAYSFVLKRHAVIDVFVLTALYVLRIVAGGQASGVQLSSWLLGFALFVFLSLASVKRYAELTATPGWIPGRGYCSDDAQWMHTTGISAGFMAVVVFALYVTAPEVAVLYSRPKTLWLLCPLLLYWLNRLWFRTSRRLVHDDPVVEALRDPQCYVVAAAAVVIMLLAI